METAQAKHPLGIKAKILLSSVFGPYAQDDEFGSRKINPMELYQNQVTRAQGPFSLRMFHRSFGLMMIQANISAPCTLLDFPSLERFTEELREKTYDIVGISSIIPNADKVKKMCELVRQYQPRAFIVVGGHIANLAGLEERIDADHIVKGEGIRWFRSFLGQDENAPILHPETSSAYGTRIIGHSLAEKPGDTAAILIPSVGCPMGCNFCSTSALFGGKGKFINFYETGDELFSVMSRLEKNLHVRSFFILDENFLYHRKRALRLLELIKEKGKSWALYVFSSAKVLKSYTMEQLVDLGIAWVWMGVEGRESKYSKLSGVNTLELVKELQASGIRVLGSSIIGMEEHTPDNMEEVIDYAVSHNSVFHQFMLYTPNPGTPLYEQHKKDGTLYPESQFPLADAHGQYRFNYRHSHIQNGQEEKFLADAFERDFAVNGPSLFRLIRVLLTGWQKYKNHPDSRIRDRFAWEVEPLKTGYAGAVWAMEKWYWRDHPMREKIRSLRKDIYKEFGWKTRCIAPVFGTYLLIAMKREARRLEKGWTYEPRVFYEKNPAALALEEKGKNTVLESGKISYSVKTADSV
ncbi:MAG: radical SAM protein [Desulfococcaceae bacterium]